MYSPFYSTTNTYKSFFNEYVVSDISKLKQYLQLEDNDKIRDLFYMHTNIVYTDSVIFKYLKNRAEELNDEDVLLALELEDYIYLNKYLFDENRYTTSYAYTFDLIEKRIKFGVLNKLNPSMIPSWYFLEKPAIIKNQWLIHFTSSMPQMIQKQGFEGLIEDLRYLGITKIKNTHTKSKQGYGFSYLLSDYKNFAKSDLEYGFKYGRNAVLFKASGLRVWHKTDREWQVIFKGSTVKDIIPIIDVTGNETYIIKNKKTNSEIIRSDDFDDVVNWITTNYRQYSKVI